jgi:hypothetical protein
VKRGWYETGKLRTQTPGSFTEILFRYPNSTHLPFFLEKEHKAVN